MFSRIFLSALFLFTSCQFSLCYAEDYSGLWWDNTKAGQGISIIQDGETIYGAWYLYDKDGHDMWLTFVGALEGNSITADLLHFTGPPLGEEWDESSVKSTIQGSITITFSDSENAEVQYRINDTVGELTLVPFANDSARLYWDPSKPGQGVGIFQEGAETYAVWYLYDQTGDDMWLTMPGHPFDTNMESELLRFRGPRLGTEWNMALVSSIAVGNASLARKDDSAIDMAYHVFSINGMLNLVPFSMSSSQESGDEQEDVEQEPPPQEGDSQAQMVMATAYVTFDRDGGMGDCGVDPWYSADCTNSKDWWGVHCNLVVHIPAIAIPDGENRWVITDEAGTVSRYGYGDYELFKQGPSVYYNDLQFTYVTPPCEPTIQGIDFSPQVLGTVENDTIDLTYLADPQFRAWGYCGQASFDWTSESIKYGWGVAVSGDPLDLTGRFPLTDKEDSGIYSHVYQADTNPSPTPRDHVEVTLMLSCIAENSSNPAIHDIVPCPWD